MAGFEIYLPRLDARTREIPERWAGVADIEPDFIVINR